MAPPYCNEVSCEGRTRSGTRPDTSLQKVVPRLYHIWKKLLRHEELTARQAIQPQKVVPYQAVVPDPVPKRYRTYCHISGSSPKSSYHTKYHALVPGRGTRSGTSPKRLRNTPATTSLVPAPKRWYQAWYHISGSSPKKWYHIWYQALVPDHNPNLVYFLKRLLYHIWYQAWYHIFGTRPWYQIWYQPQKGCTPRLAPAVMEEVFPI